MINVWNRINVTARQVVGTQVMWLKAQTCESKSVHSLSHITTCSSFAAPGGAARDVRTQ
jgi:hypothetical protein